MTIHIRSTLRESPIRAVIFGRDGVGKSTFCAGAPKCVFVAVESGLDNIDAQTVPTPESWKDMIDFVDALVEDDRCGTIAIDSLDWAEQLCWRHVCECGDDKGRKINNIEAFGYGKGYVAALNEWRILLASLTRARASGKHVLLIAHAERKPVKNPSGDDYEAWSIKLNPKAAGLIREWVDVVGFAELDVATLEQDGRVKGVSSGKRVLRTQPSAGYDVKTRFTLPHKIPLDWRAFAEAVASGKPASVDALHATLMAKLTDLADANSTLRCEKFLDDRGRSFASYTEAIATVDAYILEQKTASANMTKQTNTQKASTT